MVDLQVHLGLRVLRWAGEISSCQKVCLHVTAYMTSSAESRDPRKVSILRHMHLFQMVGGICFGLGEATARCRLP